MRGVGDAARRLPATSRTRARPMIMHEVLRRDREHEVHVDRPIRKVQRVGEQQAVDRARRADDDRVVQLVARSRTAAARTAPSARRADAGDEVELQEVPRAPDPLELGAEHPERQHVEQDVEQAAVQEHVGGELPDLELPDHGRTA